MSVITRVSKHFVWRLIDHRLKFSFNIIVKGLNIYQNFKFELLMLVMITRQVTRATQYLVDHAIQK